MHTLAISMISSSLVKIKGIIDRERFQKTLERVAEYLDASGIKKIQGINFYLTPLHPEKGGRIVYQYRLSIPGPLIG